MDKNSGNDPKPETANETEGSPPVPIHRPDPPKHRAATTSISIISAAAAVVAAAVSIWTMVENRASSEKAATDMATELRLLDERLQAAKDQADSTKTASAALQLANELQLKNLALREHQVQLAIKSSTDDLATAREELEEAKSLNDTATALLAAAIRNDDANERIGEGVRRIGEQTAPSPASMLDVTIERVDLESLGTGQARCTMHVVCEVHNGSDSAVSFGLTELNVRDGGLKAKSIGESPILGWGNESVEPGEFKRVTLSASVEGKLADEVNTLTTKESREASFATVQFRAAATSDPNGRHRSFTVLFPTP